MLNFSVCMAVYHGDKAEYFEEALESVFRQTKMPNEVVLVVDGPVGDNINKVIKSFSEMYDTFRIIRLEKNLGHAIARQAGLEAARYDYVAIMDSDDIAVPNRFEKQMAYLKAHPDVDVLGGQINEFVVNTDNIVGKRVVPLENGAIQVYMKSRCPMNQMTCIIKKESMMKVGGYQHWYCNEDYYLWVRMALDSMTFSNLPDTLVQVRVGMDMYARRGGWKYFKSEAKLQQYMHKKGIIGGVNYS